MSSQEIFFVPIHLGRLSNLVVFLCLFGIKLVFGVISFFCPCYLFLSETGFITLLSRPTYLGGVRLRELLVVLV